MFNASGNPVDFTLPPAGHGREWRVELGTGGTIDVGEKVRAEQTITRPGHSLLVLLRPPFSEGEEAADPEESRPTRA